MEIVDIEQEPSAEHCQANQSPATTETEFNSSKIRAIDKNVVHRICSGQVIVTLATAIKELVENSIDASATSVDINLIEFGCIEIQVTDNGLGVDESNFASLTLKHHTSKLSQFEDLTSIGTFGFRGEALSSLCSLTNLLVTTKTKIAKTAYRLEYSSNGQITSKTPCARSVGTTVVLKNIFQSLPVRHKEFMKNLKREFYKMVNILYGYSLISTGVRINCTNQERKGEPSKQILSVPPLDSVKERIISLFGNKQMTSLLEISDDKIPSEIPSVILQEYGLVQDNFVTKPFKLEGFLSKPYSGRSSTDRQYLFINSRPFDSPKILKIINEVYNGFSSRNQHPFVCLNIKTNQDNVDVNVSPDKRSIYLQNEKLLYSTISATLQSVLTSTSFQLNTSSDEIGHTTELHYPLVPSESESQSSSTKSLSQRSTSTSSSSPQSQSSSQITFSTPNKPKQLETVFAPQYSGNDRTREARSILTRFRYGNAKNDFFDDMSKMGSQHSAQRNNYGSSPGKDLTRSRNAKQPKLFDFIASQKAPKISKMQPETMTTCDVDSDCEEISQENDSVILLSQISNSSSLLTCEYTFGETDLLEIHTMDTEELDEKRNNVYNGDKTITEMESPPLSPIISFSQSSSTTNCTETSLTTVDDGIDQQYSQDNLVIYDDELDDDDDPSRKLKEAPSQLTVSRSNLEVKVKFDLDHLKQKLSETKNSPLKSAQKARRFRAKFSDNNAAEQELKKELKLEMFPQMEILGQFNLGFIIGRHESDLFIIDQHASDEKFNFETLEKTLVLQNQKLICPMLLELPAISENVLIDNLDVFKKNGFDFEIDEFGETTSRIKLTKIPYSKSYEFGREDIEELIFMLEDAPEKSFCRPTKIRTMLASRACRKSIMIGTSLGKKEMTEIVQHMAKLDQPWNCPHGRPTIRHLFNLNLMPDIDTVQFGH